MLIILEGPDCAGKSTLASKLACAIENAIPENAVTVFHKGPPELHPLDEYESPLFMYMPGMGQHIICDRWHWGESVYPAVLGRSSQLDDGIRLHIEMFLRSKGALVVHVSAEDRVLEQCISRRGDDLIEAGKGHQLNVLYNGVSATSLLDVVLVDGRDINTTTIQHIIHRAGMLSVAASKLNHFTTYVGSTAPRLLLLGDVRNGTYAGDLRPAFMPYPSTSGHYLMNSLARYVGIPRLSTIGIMNACDADDARKLIDTVSETMQTSPTIVALGRKASKALPEYNRHVPHPQWQRRFAFGRAAEYARNIIGRDSPSRRERPEGTAWN